MEQSKVTEMLKSITADYESINILADYLGYTVGYNPINESSEWSILLTDKLKNNSKGVIAVKNVSDLTRESTTLEIRRLHKQVIELQTEFSTEFDVQVVGFVGINRLVFFPLYNGNRDTRLDINFDTSNEPMYVKNFNLLKNQNITVQEDEFGFGEYEIFIPKDIFQQTLSSHFLTVVAFYRKKLSELITSTNLKDDLYELVDDKSKVYIKSKNLVALVEEESYIAVLSNIVDTIILRQLMRRFLEGYYGADAFEVNGIALGVGSGTMDKAIKNAVEAEAAIRIADEEAIKKLNKKKNEINNNYEIDLLADFFDEEEQNATTKLDLKKESKEQIKELTELATEQFRTVYNGDLFAGSVGIAADKIENRIAEKYPEFTAKLWMDTSAQEYSFRYEDMAPNAIEKQYENSMSQNVHIKIENGKPVVYYGNDFQEQKNKGAYYTDDKFVNYMIAQTVELEFMKRYEKIKENIESGDTVNTIYAIENLLDMKTVDLTAGGGSFLRGAFLLLADKQALLSNLDLPLEIKSKYPYFLSNDEAVYQWEKYILENMIYGVDIDYKAIIISSLTLTLSSLEHRPKDVKLPSLIGRNLIHQNSLMNSVPYYKREEIFIKYKEEIKDLRNAKNHDFSKFCKLRDELQKKMLKYVDDTLAGETSFLHVESIEINLPEIFFNDDGSLKEKGGFDVVIGNPPWEVWKPNSKEFYSQYDETYSLLKNAKEKNTRQKELENKYPNIINKWNELENRYQKGSTYFRNLDNFKYQSWIVEGRKTGSDINLYKISVERFLQLTADDMNLSILIPDNIMTDLGATGLRHLIFDECKLIEFLSFENRRGIFKSVDNRYKFAVTTISKKQEEIESFKSFFYKQDLESLQNEMIKIDYPMELVYAEPEKYSLFEPKNQVDFELYRKIKLRYPSLLETKLFDVSNDFHRTNDTQYFQEFKQEDIPLYEGKLMEQFKVLALPEESVSKQVADMKIGTDLNEWRIGIRAVGSATNRRTLISTIFPPYTVAAHSLHMQRNASNQTINEKLYLVGILNSYVMDFVLRKLITLNISQTFLKQLPIPRIDEFPNSQKIVEISLALIKLNGKDYEDLEIDNNSNDYNLMPFDELTAELNAYVAIGFDLNREDIINLMSTFESANHKVKVQEEAQRIIDIYDQLIEEIN